MVYKKGTPEYSKWRKSPKYDLWRKRISMALKDKPLSEETKRKLSVAHRNKKHSEETKQKISAALIGRSFSKEHRRKLSMVMSGKKHSEETKQKMSIAHKDKPHPNRSHPCSEETKQKIREANTGERHYNYGKHLSQEHRQKLSVAGMGRKHSEKAKQRMSTTKMKSNNPNWRGGVSFEPYTTGWTKHLRETIRKRDNYICALCGKPQNKRRHAVHHINYTKADLREENLITLCTTCHLKTNDDREYWTNLFEMVYIPDFPKERRTKNESCCR